MAQGSVVNGSAVLISGNVYTIQPPAGVEWSIHNIYYTGAIQYSIVDNGNTVSNFDSDTGAGARLGSTFNLNNTHYLQITSLISGNIVSFDGRQISG